MTPSPSGPAPRSLRVGVDVGGTHTDAVLMRGRRVLREIKTATTADVTSGVATALLAVLDAVPPERAASRVVVGTTHFTNAVLTGSGLARVAAVRVGLPASASLPPFCDWPEGLRETVRGPVFQVAGGHECDGRPIAPLDEAAVRDAGRRIRETGLREVAVSAVFSPLDGSGEARAAALLREVHPRARITESRHLGRIGLLGRENAALLNASLRPLAARVAAAFRDAAEAGGAGDAPLFIARNDGTTARVEDAERFPVLSLSSGPTNSMTGAAFLSGRSGARDAVVVDVGGTTTDLGFLRSGFPREAPREVEIGGVRTLFRMPDLLSLALGGGSLVSGDGARVGPASVGFRLPEEGLVFGGSVRTATDCGVAAGRAEIGDPRRVRDLPEALIRRFGKTVRERITEAVDRMKPDARPCPLLVVGGGAFLVPRHVEGVSEVVTVPHAGVANAVGAAIARVGGEVDRVFHGTDRAEAFRRAEAEARQRALAAGADPDRLETVEREDLPLAYLPGGARRVRVRVVGDSAEGLSPRFGAGSPPAGST